MRKVRCDQCQFGMTSVDDAENVGHARNATGFMTNDEYIAEAVDRRCFGGHDHISVVERQSRGLRKVSPTIGVGDIARFATEHAAQGLMGRDRQLTIAALEARPTLQEPELLSLPDNTDSAQEFRALNPEMVKRARELEMQYMDELKVLEDSDRDTCVAETGRPPIPTDKGGSTRPNYRSRLVCQETRGRSTIDVEDRAATFAATLPYEAFRLQLSLMMTGLWSQVGGDDDVLMLLDTSVAHLHSPLARVVFVTIDDKVCKLLEAMCGLRDAGASFDGKGA